MKVIDFLIVLVLFLLLITGLYLLWLNLPQQQVNYEKYRTAIAQNLSLKSTQFYANMRYPEKEISFHLSDSCSNKKKNDFREATEILEKLTIVNFFETADKGEITVTCSNLAPAPDQEGHFVAGEGGPALYLNTTRYAIILSGEVALYRPETCEIPQIALHELLHALGFDHNGNKDSIMFPVTDCKQQLDKEILDEVNRIYLEPSLPDLAIESLDANKTGPYLDFEVTIANYGLKPINNSILQIIIENKIEKEFEIGEIDLGAKRRLSVTNLHLRKDPDTIKVNLETPQIEITKDNNVVEVKPVA